PGARGRGYPGMAAHNARAPAEDGASVALETITGPLITDDQGRGEITLTANPYSVWLITLEPLTSP
ncbi:MAG: hypothetical protein J7M34_14575, partial [Anaerolineae bacterium]|nr:hypothetical protein [Anaerolineae bacterium]